MTVAEGVLTIDQAKYTKALQWGRNLTVAEGLRPAGRLAAGAYASMGPQLDSCGRKANGIEVSKPIWRFNGAAT